MERSRTVATLAHNDLIPSVLACHDLCTVMCYQLITLRTSALNFAVVLRRTTLDTTTTQTRRHAGRHRSRRRRHTSILDTRTSLSCRRGVYSHRTRPTWRILPIKNLRGNVLSGTNFTEIQCVAVT